MLWVHASSASRILQGYQEIARHLALPGHHDPRNNACQLVADWCAEKNPDDGVGTQWLIIFDSVDDMSVFDNPLILPGDGTSHCIVEGKTLRDYLPRELIQGQALLATTRNADIAKLLLNGTPGIQIGSLSREEALEMFHGQSECEYAEESSEIESLLQQLAYVPLAITQATAYIDRSMISVNQYLNILGSDDRLKSDLLTQELQDQRRPPGYPNSIFRTWRISFEQINGRKPQAAKLLALMAMLDGQQIPLWLISQEGMSEVDLHMAIGELLVYSLVSKHVASDSMSIHHLVQASVRVWLAETNRIELYVDRAVEIIADADCFWGDYETMNQCKELMPHASSVMQHHKTTGQDFDENYALLLYNRARYRLLSGQYAMAHQEIQRAYTISREKDGEEGSLTLTILEELAAVLGALGNFKEQERVLRRILESKRESTDDELHPDTLQSMCTLARCLYDQARFHEAKSLQSQVLSIQERIAGPGDPATMIVVAELGSTMFELGHYESALAYRHRASSGFKKIYGIDHPVTLQCMSHLALSLCGRGDYKQGENLQRQVLSGQEKIMGTEHPQTLYTMCQIGYTLAEQAHYKEAEEIFCRVTLKQKEILGDDHRDTLRTMHFLAHCMRKRGKYDEAEELFVQVLTAYEKLLGTSHTNTPGPRNSLNNLKLEQHDSEFHRFEEWPYSGRFKLSRTLAAEERCEDLLKKIRERYINQKVSDEHIAERRN